MRGASLVKSQSPSDITMEQLLSITINSKTDMEEAEEFIKKQIGASKTQRCAFLRSMEYMKIRLRAVYSQPFEDTLVAYYNGLKIVLKPDRILEIWTFDPPLPTIMELPCLGKRNLDYIESSD